ncbi:MAG: NAD(P)/FAD-dependent oxidoreductase [Chloroflexi bacterium]|nr:NAD(P)/FAD-dependent oxidoreductase [Chloroflexota bacterium]
MTSQLLNRAAVAPKTALRHQVVIIGGGNAGLSVAARLRRARRDMDIAIIEPSETHYYQPLWTLVGAGVYDKKVTKHEEAPYIPKGVTWIRDSVVQMCPDDNTVVTSDGTQVTYEHLVVAPGIQLDWDKIKGMPDALESDGVCSNYAYEHVDKTWAAMQAVTGGNAIFTHPNTAIKCGGAPQKIMYLADDHFRKAGVRDRTNVIFATANAGLFAVTKYAETLKKVAARKGIDTRFRHNLVEVRPESKEAVFEHLDSGDLITMPYQMIHVTPPQSAPDFVKRSLLADDAGWVAVDKFTLQHVRYPNVFSLGDASSLPTSKTGAAVRKQAPVLVQNLLSAMQQQPLTASYDGYAACPLVTGYGKMVLAEFDYDLTPRESFPFDQSKERYSMYLFKKHGLPALYWHGILQGRL